MNSIASPRRTDGAGRGAYSPAQVATILASLMLAVVIISFRPFQPAGYAADGSEGGDIVNQLGFGTLGAVAFFAMLTFADRRVLSSLLSPWWLLMLGFLALSVMNAADPNSAVRAASFTLIGIATIAAVLALPRDADSFSTVLAFTGFCVVGLSYLGLLVFPNQAMHIGEAFEPEHEGLWRGVFSHKNVAAPVMACISFAGIYLYRRGRRGAGSLLFVSALFFLAHTGSKTTTGLVPLAILVVAGPGLIGMRLLTPVLFAVAIVGTALATLGIVFIEPIKHLAHEFFPDLTYTGRTTLWAFSGEMIAKRPWTGYGYVSFWGTPFMDTVEKPFDQAWDVSGSVHAHNGYIDIAIPMGLPALAVAVVAFLVEPARDYIKTPLRRENVFLSDMFMMMVLFTTLNAFLESFFFRRADPVWLFFVFGALGLRLSARFAIRSSQSG